ncbi:unnamed protein product [Cyclocybe aegerita]|uniref:Reverse transcriptase domain-containing protein n=1 Tax=Cyclocybe aegerita TaxID=1973307 RepID=A0A8S0VQD5_CYCAE|nr:unnamed protein product [Cyclocybe aegerita]
MDPDDVHLTAVNTPFGLYEWLVMPMGLQNAPSIHQHHVTHALCAQLGHICHIYLDDIIIWLNSMAEHIQRVEEVLEALRAAKLYCNPKKTELFCTEIYFLGHRISARGIEACNKKAEKILSWPVSKNATDVRSFLGLVRYMAAFLPNLSQHTAVLNPLMSKDFDKKLPQWLPEHQLAFDAIKKVVAGHDCLTTIDYAKMPKNKIYVTTDASNLGTGAVLSFGMSWETAHPVTFDSITFKGPQLNYPVHEKEMLAVICALHKWHSDLIGVPFLVYTDHKTLMNFQGQKDLSCRQARWMEFLS